MAKVYFKSASTPFPKDALHASLDKLFEKINVVEKGDIVAVKLHMGEFGNIGYIRPVFVRKIVDFIKKRGGEPFITDTTTLYGGRRGNAVQYLITSAINGFSISSMNAPVIIADGLLGNDEKIVSVDTPKNIDIGIASAIHEADCMIVLSHFKGHGMAGFGGAIKNLGMGCVGKSGKKWQHEKSKPSYNEEKCILCLKCTKFCPANAIHLKDHKIEVDYEKCYGCGACLVLCEQGCFYLDNVEEFLWRIAIASKAVMKKFKDKISFLNFLLDITPMCDCCSFADKPIVNDIGILASLDPVSIDKASYDMVCNVAGKDVFMEVHGIDGTVQLREAEKLGVGEMNYELISV